MKIGTVKWFNLQKGYGFVHPDEGGPNIFVHIAAVESAGMSDLKEGQRIIFEIQRDERIGNASAVSLKPLVFATTPHLDGSFATANPFDIISAFISSTMSAVSQFANKSDVQRPRTRLPLRYVWRKTGGSDDGTLRVSGNYRTCGNGYR